MYNAQLSQAIEAKLE